MVSGYRRQGHMPAGYTTVSFARLGVWTTYCSVVARTVRGMLSGGANGPFPLRSVWGATGHVEVKGEEGKEDGGWRRRRERRGGGGLGELDIGEVMFLYVTPKGGPL